jgi:hypothetical protein
MGGRGEVTCRFRASTHNGQPPTSGKTCHPGEVTVPRPQAGEGLAAVTLAFPVFVKCTRAGLFVPGPGRM